MWDSSPKSGVGQRSVLAGSRTFATLIASRASRKTEERAAAQVPGRCSRVHRPCCPAGLGPRLLGAAAARSASQLWSSDVNQLAIHTISPTGRRCKASPAPRRPQEQGSCISTSQIERPQQDTVVTQEVGTAGQPGRQWGRGPRACHCHSAQLELLATCFASSSCWCRPLRAGSLLGPAATAGGMGSGPALALLLLAALGTLHRCSPLAAAGGTPTLGAVDITLGHSARRLLEAIGVTAGTLECSDSSKPYVAPLTINTPGLYKFRIKALGTNTNSAGRASAHKKFLAGAAKACPLGFVLRARAAARQPELRHPRCSLFRPSCHAGIMSDVVLVGKPSKCQAAGAGLPMLFSCAKSPT